MVLVLQTWSKVGSSKGRGRQVQYHRRILQCHVKKLGFNSVVHDFFKLFTSQAIIKINKFHGPCPTKVYVHTHTHIDTQTHTKLPMISATLPTSPEVIHTQNAKDRGRVCWRGEGVPLMYFKQRITRWSHVNLHILLWSITTGKSGGREYSIKIFVQASIIWRSCSGKRWQGFELGHSWEG